MSYEEQVKEQIRENLDSPPQISEENEVAIDDVIDEAIIVERDFPIYNISVNHFGADSRKPSNITVEFDIATALEILAQAGYLTGDPLGAFASVSALCALVTRKTKIELEPETGFVYWVAYEYSPEPWEILKDELVELASSKSKSMDVEFELTEEEVERRIRRLRKIKSFEIEYKQGNEYVILRERCSADWS